MRKLQCVFLVVSLFAFTAEAAVAGEVGALLGGAAGAIIGNNIGSRHYRGTNTLLGAVGGAVLGHAFEESARPAAPAQGYAPYRQPYYEPAPRAYGYGGGYGGGYAYETPGRTPYPGRGGPGGYGQYYHSDCDCSY